MLYVKKKHTSPISYLAVVGFLGYTIKQSYTHSSIQVNSQNNLGEKKKVGGLIISNFKNY